MIKKTAYTSPRTAAPRPYKVLDAQHYRILNAFEIPTPLVALLNHYPETASDAAYLLESYDPEKPSNDFDLTAEFGLDFDDDDAPTAEELAESERQEKAALCRSLERIAKDGFLLHASREHIESLVALLGLRDTFSFHGFLSFSVNEARERWNELHPNEREIHIPYEMF